MPKVIYITIFSKIALQRNKVILQIKIFNLMLSFLIKQTSKTIFLKSKKNTLMLK